MKGTFVLIFRQGSRKLTEEEQNRRTQEVRTWALQHIQTNSLDPRILGADSHRLGESAGATNDKGTVTAFNFLEADSFNHAVQIAETHPGLRYGISIEVRPWMDPRTQPPAK